MSGQDFFANQRRVTTPSGHISYVERGSGPVALFVHWVATPENYAVQP